MLKEIPLNISKEKLSEFCRKWQIKELSLFGSIVDPIVKTTFSGF